MYDLSNGILDDHQTTYEAQRRHAMNGRDETRRDEGGQSMTMTMLSALLTRSYNRRLPLLTFPPPSPSPYQTSPTHSTNSPPSPSHSYTPPAPPISTPSANTSSPHTYPPAS